jgi:hypothetical protein
MKLNELKAELKEKEKELKNSIRSCWSLKVEKFDRDNGEEYQVWSQIFDTEEQLDKFVEQNKEWKKMDTIDIPMYDISKRFIPEIHSHNESELKAKIEYIKKGISACEEILNSQQTKPCRALATTKKPDRTEDGSSYTKDKTADTQTLIKQREMLIQKEINKFDEDESEILMTLHQLCRNCFDVGFKQALSQRNKEILEMLKKKLKEVEEYRVWDECDEDRKDGKIGILEDLIYELEQQLTNSEGKE